MAGKGGDQQEMEDRREDKEGSKTYGRDVGVEVVVRGDGKTKELIRGWGVCGGEGGCVSESEGRKEGRGVGRVRVRG